MNTRATNWTLGLTLGGSLLALAQPALATSSIRNAFNARYPTSTLVVRTGAASGDSCLLCHTPSDRADSGNCYKEAILQRMNAGRTAAQAIVDVENLDSDGDGTPNGVEITMARTDLPGQVGYNPGLIGATGTDPCASNPAAAITNQRETPAPIPTCPADLDDGSGNGTLDNAVDINDLIFFLIKFEDGNVVVDLDDGTGTGTHDDAVDINDLLFFLIRFEGGC